MRFTRLPVAALILFAAIWALLLPSRLAIPASQTFTDDAGSYHKGALHLLHDGMYSMDGIHPLTDREPGYSLFLAGIYGVAGDGNRVAIFLAQAILFVLAVCFFCREVSFIHKPVAPLLFAILLLEPAAFHLIFSALREGFALVLFLAFLTSLFAWKRTKKWLPAIATGVFAGALSLAYFPLFPVAIVTIITAAILWRFSVLKTICAALICVLCIAALMHRNSLDTTPGRCVVPGCVRSSMAWVVRGGQVETFTALDPFRCLWAEYITRDLSSRPPACAFGGQIKTRWPDGVDAHLEELTAAASSARETLLRHPVHYGWISAVWAFKFHLPYVDSWGMTYNALEALYTVLLYAGIVILLFRRKEWKSHYLLCLIIIIATTGLFALVDVEPRYRMPIVPAYALLAAAGYISVRYTTQRPS